MAIKNGTLQVPSFDYTGNPGEYTVTGAIVNSLTCPDGALNIQIGWAVWSVATDANTGILIPGIVHRYKITAVNAIDFSTCDLTVLWDEQGPEQDVPTNGSYCVFSETSANHKFGYPVDELIYPEVNSGMSTAIFNEEIQNITDLIAGGATKLVKPFVIGDWSATGNPDVLALTVPNTLGNQDLVTTVYEEVSPGVFVETSTERALDTVNVYLWIATGTAFAGKLVAI